VTRLYHRYTLVSIATMLLWLGSQAIRPYIALRLNEIGASETEIGIAVSSFALLGLLLALPFGRLVDRVGPTKVALASFPVLIGTSFGYSLVQSLAGMIAVQVVVGIAFMSAWLALQAIIMGAKQDTSLSFHIAVFSLGWGFGQTGGPMIGALIYQASDFATLARAMAGVHAVLLALGVVLWKVNARHEGSRQRSGGDASIRSGLAALRPSITMRLILLASLIGVSVEAIRNSFYPLHLVQRGYTVGEIGVLITVASLSSLLARALLPLLRRRLTQPALLIGSVSVSVVGVALTPVLSGYALLTLGAAFMGLGTGVFAPVSIEMMSAGVPAQQRGVAAAVRAMSNRFANLAQPLLFSGFIAVVGLAGAFPVAGVALGGCCIWMGRLVPRWNAEVEARRSG